MNNDVRSFDLQEFIRLAKPVYNYADQVIIVDMHGEQLANIPEHVFPIRFEAISTILVCRGELVATLDYIPYTLTRNMVLERVNVHLMNGFQASHDFQGYHVLFGKKVLDHLFEEIVPMPNGFALSKRHEPVHKLNHEEFSLLTGIIERLRSNIARPDHHFQKGLVLNEVRNYVMELSNMAIVRAKKDEHIVVNHFEELAVRFMQLLAENCRTWHEVTDYSTRLCVTPVYLSRTVKSMSGLTAMDWINKARIAEAKIMLRKQDVSIQQVADALGFSDQSAFGKFFKKHTGKSPVEYRKEL